MKKICMFILWGLLSVKSVSQSQSIDTLSNAKELRFKYQALIIPSVLIGYGVVGLESHTLKGINTDTKNEINEHIDKKFTIDDFSQYSTFLSVYALNAAGIKGRNNFKDRTVILACAYLIMGTAVNIIKTTGNEIRPDGTSNNSFPSGHTATAFMGAEFFYQEYKEVSVWYGISGYLVAAGTGFFRMYNDRHWFSDVAAGAGIGILSTKIAYWVHPLIQKRIFKKKENLNGVIIPTYNGREYGLAMAVSF
jgi:hypothetical protein